ncbi:MAG TPA: VOC family protein [Actinopolymorphaceae bacterium]
MLGSSRLIAFAATVDLARARSFYEQVLGPAVTESDDHSCVFDVGGTMLRVTAVREVAPAEYTVLGWQVDDITAAIRDLVSSGVVFTRCDGMGQDDDGVWTAPGGDKVAWFVDPDGNTLSLTEFS